MTDETRYEGRGFTIPVIGDSNVVALDGMMVRDLRRPDVRFVFHSHFVPALRFGDLIDEHGNLRKTLRDSLIGGVAIDHSAGLTPVTRSGFWQETFDRLADAAVAGGRRDDRQILVFFFGHGDFSEIVFRLGPAVDFGLPPQLHANAIPDAIGSTTTVPLALVDGLIAPGLAALARAFDLLTEGGFERIYMVGLRPPAVDDVAFEAKWLIRSRAHLRYKVTALYNERIARLCEVKGVAFVDLWQLLMHDGIFDEGFELDLIHINSAASALVARRIVADYVDRSLA